MPQRLVYISSKGIEEDPEQLHLARFGNALRLVEREGRGNPNFENLDALRAVFKRRQDAWDADHPGEVPR